ncbi:hypothetical protein [Methylophaga nitratireducenticrescens]|uniref:hypothetical protein n=1 Tax=Methylophaga nitratireducenticrescens TaxID=754476 RepID=UPI000CDCBD15|nr:hypothetical protein [Methylophaga nitratireducenticrescens]AUZ83776.1 hypothetical protein CDW43_03960 [Methylophaga nitratireducenticrescens]
MKKLLLLPLLLLMSFNAHSAFLTGQTLTYQYYFPTMSSPYSNADNGDVIVGAGIEVNNVADNMATLDISDTNLLIDFSSSSYWNSSGFNGFKLTDTFGLIADFTSVSINPSTNMSGFDLSLITVLADEIWVNWQGLSFNTDTIVSLDINPSAVPIPAAVFLFAPALFGFIGLRYRAKNKAA